MASKRNDAISVSYGGVMELVKCILCALCPLPSTSPSDNDPWLLEFDRHGQQLACRLVLGTFDLSLTATD